MANYVLLISSASTCQIFSFYITVTSGKSSDYASLNGSSDLQWQKFTHVHVDNTYILNLAQKMCVCVFLHCGGNYLPGFWLWTGVSLCRILPSLSNFVRAAACMVLVSLSPDHSESPLWCRDSHVGMGQVREDWRHEHCPEQDLTGKFQNSWCLRQPTAHAV